MRRTAVRHTVGCKSFEIIAPPWCRESSHSYSRQYQYRPNDDRPPVAPVHRYSRPNEPVGIEHPGRETLDASVPGRQCSDGAGSTFAGGRYERPETEPVERVADDAREEERDEVAPGIERRAAPDRQF